LNISSDTMQSKRKARIDKETSLRVNRLEKHLKQFKRKPYNREITIFPMPKIREYYIVEHAETIKQVQHCANNGNNFAISLMNGLKRYKRWTDRQLYYAQRIK
jgi:hypothetical protein